MPISPGRILFCDDHLLAVDKLSGELVVEGGRGRGKGKDSKKPLLNFLKKQYPGLRTLHRLDFETSGVVVFARTKQVYEQILSSKFSSWVKTYRTIVVGKLKEREGVIEKRLPSRSSKLQAPSLRQGYGRQASSKKVPSSKFQSSTCSLVEAVTKYSVLEEYGGVSYVEAIIETGRHHQIRRHFACVGHPLILDRVYGDPKLNQRFSNLFGYRRFFLHAVRIELPHPITGQQLVIEAPMPRAFEEVLEKLKG